MLCYADEAIKQTEWCYFFLTEGQVALESALNELATCPLCK